MGYHVHPIMSYSVRDWDTRFGSKDHFKSEIEGITGEEIITTVVEAEQFGPKKPLDALVVAPTTGNTIAKLTYGITDTPVTMAVKATLRNEKPVVLAIATNDGISTNGPNIMTLLYRQNYYLVPLTQDDPVKIPNSLIANFGLIIPTLCEAMNSNWNEKAIPETLRAKMLRGPKR
jgi:dipicolinate synthase subunit B